MIHYTLEPNPNVADVPDGPPEKLALAFATADVVILGWRLGVLANHLREKTLVAVRTLARRYAELDRAKPFVADIIITPWPKLNARRLGASEAINGVEIVF